MSLTPQEQWQATLNQLDLQASLAHLWVRDTQLVAVRDWGIVVQCNTDTLRDLCQGRGYREIVARWRAISGNKAAMIKFVTQADIDQARRKQRRSA